jgi:asparagine synthase (glutamine-hydrolysing)
MLRYVSILWDATSPRATEYAAMATTSLARLKDRWHCALKASGLSVFTNIDNSMSDVVYVLPENAGIILGRLFAFDSETSRVTRIPSINQNMAARMVETSGAFLTERFWGSYVAFMRNPDGTRTFAIRDCSGKVPCYRTTYNNVHICCADLSDLQELELPPFTINWRYLAAFIYVDRMQVRDCAFNEVTELLAGDCFEIKRGIPHLFSLWNPGNLGEAGPVADYATARSTLRATTQLCIDAWASVYRSIVVRASGGLDSSIVLGCLSRSVNRPNIVCANEFSDDPSDDERRYARLATSRAGVRLVEHLRAPTKFVMDPSIIAAQKIGKPNISSLVRANEIEPINAIVHSARAESVWTGQGGDHIFYQMKTSLSAADYFSHHGFRRGFLASVADAARLSREPYYVVLRDATRLARHQGRWVPPLLKVTKPYFVNPDFIGKDIQEYVSTPWASLIQHLPKGKQYQILLLAECLNRHRTMPGAELVDEHHPLQSQPLMELCIRTPSYVLLKGGRQRALARDAFGDCLPDAVAHREDKGDTSWFVREFIRRNERSVREALLDGVLVRERIVARAALEPYLVNRHPMRVEQYWALLACLACEGWIRSWSGSTIKAAA